jgi:hypothetical protein
MHRTLRSWPLALLLVAPALAQATVDHLALGKMWTFENPPLAYLEREYGFKPDQAWLDSLRLGALRLGERGNPWCSASFVSPQGLIMTNHHCVRDKIAETQGQQNWVADGFAATALGEEVPIPGLTVQQLVAQEDVTQRVDEGVTAGDDDATVAKKREANIAAIVRTADAAHPDAYHQVVALYQGAVQQLYRYRIYQDIRLVCAPHLQTAHYGGDPDNFTFPRWSIDFSFLRAYEAGKPADTKAHYFRWRERGAQENDLVFVPGNPGSTNRQLTQSQLEVQRDVEYPVLVEQLANSMAILRPYADDNPGLLTTLLGWENSHKSIAGTLAGLRDASLMQRKATHEGAFRQAIAADAELTSKYGSLWDDLAALAQRRRQLLPKVLFYSPNYSSVLERGLAMAKALDPTLDEPARQAARAEALDMRITGNPITEALVVDHYRRAMQWLPADDPFLAALLGQHRHGDEVDWGGMLGQLGRSQLTKARAVKQILEAESAAALLAGSDDYGMVVARTLWPLMRDAGAAMAAVDAAAGVLGTRLGQALHAVFGNATSPDATMTLRFSDGRVRGYDYNGTTAPWATTFYGLFARRVEFGGKHPFDIPAPWLAAEAELDLRHKVCFVSTNDIVGGNSGSCVVDRDLRVVGLIFDGNIESLANDFYYTQQRARAVSVHTDAIVAALQHVYGMGRVVDELRNGAK